MADATLIVKATRLCNLRCSYCNDWRAGPDQTMTFDVLAAMTAGALRDPDHELVTFVWHGGETTVLPLRFYEKALFLQARLRRRGQAVRNQLQTNGTRIDGRWARFLRAHEFEVGVSIDGPPELHDRERRYAGGRPSFADAMRGIAVLREHDVPFSVLMVVDEHALALGPERVFDFFVENGIRSFGFNAVCPTNVPDAAPGTPIEHYVEPVRMSAFLAGIYDRWRAHGDPRVRVREIAALRARLSGGTARLCTLRGDCLGEYFLVEPHGDVAHCDLFLGDERYTLGNVLEHDFRELRASPALAELRRGRQRELAAMEACPDFDVCRGWCPHEQYLAVRHDPAHRTGCCGLRPLIEHVRGSLAREAPRTPLPVLAG